MLTKRPELLLGSLLSIWLFIVFFAVWVVGLTIVTVSAITTIAIAVFVSVAIAVAISITTSSVFLVVAHGHADTNDIDAFRTKVVNRVENASLAGEVLRADEDVTIDMRRDR